MPKKNIIIRPKGALYLVGFIFILCFFSTVTVGGIYCIVKYDSLSVIECFLIVLAIIGCIGITVFYIIQLITYKVIISPQSIHIAAEREWFIFLQKAKTLSYSGLSSLQYCEGITAGNWEKPFMIIAAIVFRYYDGAEETINLNRFSKKQIKRIMQTIKVICKDNFNMEVEIRPDSLPCKKKKTKKY